MESRYRLIASVFLLMVLLAVGTIAYRGLEGWSTIDALYFSTTTLTTIGYGDLHPTHELSKLFTVFYIIGGVSLTLIALTSLASHFFNQNYEKTAERIEKNIWHKVRRKKYKI